jgi:hypothetical protein
MSTRNKVSEGRTTDALALRLKGPITLSSEVRLARNLNQSELRLSRWSKDRSAGHVASLQCFVSPFVQRCDPSIS